MSSTWPIITDYKRALQKSCGDLNTVLTDPVLGSSVIPRMTAQFIPHYGQQNVVFRLQHGATPYAVKLFCQPLDDRAERYRSIQNTMRKLFREFAQDDLSSWPFCEFDFLDKGFNLDGESYPLLKMKWIDGVDLGTHVRELVMMQLSSEQKSAMLCRLARKWYLLMGKLSIFNISHGNLEPSNILVQPDGELTLLDYDTMCVPELMTGRRASELPCEHVRHPLSGVATLFSQSADNFSAWITYASLVALSLDPSLYRFSGPSWLLFNDADLKNTNRKESISHALRNHLLPELSALAHSVELLCQQNPSEICSLDSLEVPGCELWAPDARKSKRVTPDQLSVCTDSSSSLSRSGVKPPVIATHPTTPPSVNPEILGVRSFMAFAEKMEEECGRVLCLSDLFERRYIRKANNWAVAYKKLSAFFSDLRTGDFSYHLFLETHLSIAFACGWILNRKTGIRAYPFQKGRDGRVLWKPSVSPAPLDYSRWKITEHLRDSGGDSIALTVSISYPVEEDADQYIEENQLRITRVISVSPVSGPEYGVLTGADEAVRLAEKVQSVAVTALKQARGARNVHIFASAPVSFMFFLGQLGPALTPIQLYEYGLDVDETRGHRYGASFLLDGNEYNS